MLNSFIYFINLMQKMDSQKNQNALEDFLLLLSLTLFLEIIRKFKIMPAFLIVLFISSKTSIKKSHNF